jgi:hypothetical protein
MIYPLSRIPNAQKATSYDEGRMNALEGENNVYFAGKLLRTRQIMISPLMSKVKPRHRADFAALCDCSVVEAAPAARLKALASVRNCVSDRRV